MSRRPGLAAAAAVVVTVLIGALVAAPGAAQAQPSPDAYSGATHGDVLSLGLNAAGIANVDAALAHSATSTDSTASPRTHAESANVDANAVGIPVGVASDQANSGPAEGADSYTAGLGSINVPGVLQVGALNGSGQTNWAGDQACVPDGTPLAQSNTTLANARLGLTLAGIGLRILELGAVETAGNTTLSGGSVVSTSSGNISSLSLINGLVGVEILENPTLTATSDGSAGSIESNDYRIAVTIAGQRTELGAGMSLPINLNVGVLSVNLTLGVGQLDDITQGATGSGSMSFLELSGNINGPLGARLASLDLGLLPLSASSTAPQGGVDCGGLDPPAITAPESGAQTGETPTITGTGQPGATVTVTDGDTELGTATVGEDGNWLLTPENPLPPGEHTIEAVQSSGDEVSEPSDPVTFTVVDTQAPDPPSITGPEDGSTIGNDTPEITGTGEPGATVTVTDGDTELGTATVGEDGTWSLTPEEPLQDGEHTIVATQEDAAGNVSDPSSEVSFTVDTQAPDPPTIESPADGSTIGNDTPVVEGTGEPGATVDVSVDGESVGEATVDGDGNWSLPLDEPLSDGDHVIEAVQTDPAGNSSEPAESTVTVDATPPEAPTITAPENGSTVEPTTTITGEGEPGNEVTVSVDGEEVGTVTVGENGTWTLELDEPLAPGDHTASAVQTDDRGRDSPESNEVSFTVAADAIAAPEITAPESGSSTQDTTPVIEGTGDPGATVDVIVDGELIGQSTVDESGNWRFEPTTPLAPGDHTITATQTVDGQTSPESDAVIVTIEPAEAAPDAPVVTNPQDGGEVEDRTPVVEGSGETGATVDVVVDGEPAGSAAVDADGSWSLDAPELACGEHTLSATQTDNAGATSDPTEVSFTVVCAGDGGPGDGGPGDGGPGDVPGGGPGGGDGSDGGQDLITAPPVPSGPPAGIGDTGPGVGQDGSGYADPGQDGAGYGDAGYGDAGQDGLAQTGAPLTVVAWLGLLALVAGGALLRRFRADR